MGRKGRNKQKDVTREETELSTKKKRLKPYRKKHVNHRSRQFWKDYNDGLDALSKFDEEE